MKTNRVELLQEIASNQNAKILDWGCGRGGLIDNLKSLGCSYVSGLEVDAAFAREDIYIDSDTIAWLEKRPEKYDVIITSESFYYVVKGEQDKLWLAFYKALAPGGKIVVITFNGAIGSSNWNFQKDLGMKLIPNEILLRNLAASAGFQSIELFSVTPAHRTLFGKTVSYLFSIFRVVNYKFKYTSERGLDSQNPTIFTKQILLRATKPMLPN